MYTVPTVCVYIYVHGEAPNCLVSGRKTNQTGFPPKRLPHTHYTYKGANPKMGTLKIHRPVCFCGIAVRCRTANRKQRSMARNFYHDYVCRAYKYPQQQAIPFAKKKKKTPTQLSCSPSAKKWNTFTNYSNRVAMCSPSRITSF